MSSQASGWRPPLCDSRTGASHRRRGAPCQDSSGVWSFLDAAKRSVQLLVVSDGHGGSRYDRSDVGSRLACRVALQTTHALFCSQDAIDASREQWSQWLAQELPRQITDSWRQQVLAHAEAHPRSDGAAVSTIPYGATLGLLLLTPRWWGYTGLGDWDLVRLDSAGLGELVSEEPDAAGGGEATYSLCMEGAERFFAPRSGFEAIPADSPAFSLLLSSDGIRKSCGTDADFLILSHYLCGLPQARRGEKTSELPGALDHISSQGSGDDVSVAIARWGLLSASERRASLRRASKPVIVQPKLDPGAAKAAKAAAEGDGSSWFAAAFVPPWLRAQPWLLSLTGALLLTAAGVGASAVLGWGPFARLEPEPEQFNPEQLTVVREEAKSLCTKSRKSLAFHSTDNPAGNESSEDRETQHHEQNSQEEHNSAFRPPIANGNRQTSKTHVHSDIQIIRNKVTPYKKIFEDLADGSKDIGQVLKDAKAESLPRLAVLIAWSLQIRGLISPDSGENTRMSTRLLDWIQSTQSPLNELCPELRQVLSEQWMAAKSKKSRRATTAQHNPPQASMPASTHQTEGGATAGSE